MTNIKVPALVSLVFAITLSASASAHGQSRPRRVTANVRQTPAAESRPRRVHPRPSAATVRKQADAFVDRLNQLIDEYLKPITLRQPQR